jgi:NADPH:quinone reductase
VRAGSTSRGRQARTVLALTDGFPEQVREPTAGRGVDVVLDPLGDWPFVEAVRALAPEGRILVAGFAVGGIPKARSNRLLLKNVSAVGVTWDACFDIDPYPMQTAAARRLTLYAVSALQPLVGGEFGFDEIPDALHELSRETIRGRAGCCSASSETCASAQTRSSSGCS